MCLQEVHDKLADSCLIIHNFLSGTSHIPAVIRCIWNCLALLRETFSSSLILVLHEWLTTLCKALFFQRDIFNYLMIGLYVGVFVKCWEKFFVSDLLVFLHCFPVVSKLVIPLVKLGWFLQSPLLWDSPLLPPVHSRNCLLAGNSIYKLVSFLFDVWKGFS